MKLPILLLSSAMFLSEPASAQGFGSASTCNNCFSLSSGTTVFGGVSTEPYCDNKNNTSAEASECKLKFWREEVDRIEKQNADVMKALAHAKERVEAFSKSR